MSDTTLTIRIDDDTKRQLIAAAAAEDRSVTSFVIRAVKERISHLCPRCGHSHTDIHLRPCPIVSFQNEKK